MDTEVAKVARVNNFHVIDPFKLKEVLKTGLSPNVHSVL